jgi:imidazolonepropionase-like amidohydrolase
VREVVREYIATTGIDFVKYASTAHGYRQFIGLSPDSQRAIVEEAHAVGLKAQACAMTPETLKMAITAGVDLLQHASSTGRYGLPQETLELIVERQLPSVLLLFTDRCLAALLEKVERGEVSRLSGERALTSDENARRLIAAGAKIILALDGGVFGAAARTSRDWGSFLTGFPDNPYHLGSSHVFWLRSAIERGLSPSGALLAATRNIAEAYGVDAELGTLEPGKRADLLVLDADPLADPQNYLRIAHVVKDGRLIDRDRLPEQPVLTR